MAHLNFKRREHGPAVADEWLAATAAATQFAGRIAGRDEIAVKLGPGFAAGAGTAQFSPALLEVEVDTNVMLPGVKPEDVHPSDELFRARHPLFIGALAHEAFHARYSRWVPLDLHEEPWFTPRKNDVLIALEESRIEARGLRRMPSIKAALAAIVFDLLGKDFKVSDDAYGASIASALMLARVDAGSITTAEAKPFRELILTILDADTLDTLRALWLEYHALPFEKHEPLPLDEMDSIATRWLEALGMDASDEGGEGMAAEFAMAEEGKGEKGEGSGGEGEGESDGEGGGGGLSDKVKKAANDAKHKRELDAADKVGDVKAKRRAAQRAADADRHKKGKDAAKEAFGEPGAPKDGKKHGFANTGRSEVRWQKPTERERAAGVRLARLFEKVIYSDRRVAKVKQEAPGGRLHGRGQVQRAAQKAAGQHASAEGWVVKKRTHVDEPKIRVGVMLDVSGSMSAQAAIAGSLAYALGNAVERNDGEFGMVLFGREILGVIKPGQKIDRAPRISAHCGWENFAPALYALDETLDLVDGDGLRVLVLLSDGVFVHNDQEKAADALIPLLASKGVIVVHVDIDGNLVMGHHDHYNPSHFNPFPPVVVSREMDPVEASNLIGQHIIESVKKFKGVAA